ncbi:MAG: double-strand break repair protein AddB [Pseudomonadota bacterium]
MSAPTARLATIPPETSFVDALADGLLKRFDEPLALSRVTLLLPTRRAVRSLQEAFLRHSGGRALLLPRMMPLGDLDPEEILLGGEAEAADEGAFDLPPALPGLTRQLMLARLVQAWRRRKSGATAASGTAPQDVGAVELAGELARFFDQVQTEGLDFSGLDGLVEKELAAHWEETLEFLRLVTEHWPKIEADEGCIGPAERRRRLHERRIALWKNQPPQDPVIAAGSTGSIPSTADLLKAITTLPQGQVILPGLDQDCSDAVWSWIGQDPTHPQYGLAQLLEHLGVERSEVVPWQDHEAPQTARQRRRLVAQALLPAETTQLWQVGAANEEARQPALDPATALAGVKRLSCSSPGEEALAIALLLREALETPDKTAALVTPDRNLARRVAAELRRWDIDIDDSAGQPLALTPPGQFLRLTAALIEEDCAPLALLSALKHPLARGGQPPGHFREALRRLERAVLRGPRPAPGFQGLQAALAESDLEAEKRRALTQWLDSLAAAYRPCQEARRGGGNLADVLEAHLHFTEYLAAGPPPEEDQQLWAGEAGEAAADFVTELRQAVEHAPDFGPGDYPALLDSLLRGRVVRPRYGRHPRLSILGPLEARLLHRDLLILGSLNEGTWPAESEPGPWLSRPMRRDFGLPPLERRIGLSAHDFAQAFCAPEVVLSRSTRVEGSPTVPSRWLLRLEACLESLGQPQAIADISARLQHWVEEIDRPAEVRACAPPAPRPPLEARPDQLSVTRVETWLRDPYALYARQILRLKPLDPLDADPSLAERGTLIHRILERFVRRWPRELPDDPVGELLAIGAEEFEHFRAWPGLYAFWMPRFRRIAQWVAEAEARRRTDMGHGEVLAEVSGILDLPSGFRLTAKADRIERAADGSLALLDYKTGGLPSKKAVHSGIAPQLPLEAAIAQAGGFQEVPAGPVAALVFWRLSGAEAAGAELEVGPPKDETLEDVARAALEGLERLVAAFQDPDTAYHARPRPSFALRYNDYSHLARLKEWASSTEAS